MTRHSAELSFLRQNITPDASERITILKSISEAEVRLSTLASADQAQELHTIAVLSSQLAPIRRLPTEILSKIFVDPSLHTSISKPRAYMLAGRGMDPLTAVSFHWRGTALSTPQFWSIFSLSLSGSEDVAQLLRLYLDRSKSCPLSLEIRAPSAVRMHHGMLKDLLDTCERWAAVRLEIHPNIFPLLSPARCRLPRLQKLDLQSPAYNAAADESSVTQMGAFELAPRLSRLGIEHHLLPPLPLAQIKYLTVSFSSLSLAAKCPNLRSLCCRDSPNVMQPDEPILISGISTLSITPSLLRYLSTPDIDHLQLVWGGAPWSQAHFSTFLERSSISLRVLVLEDIHVHGKDLISLFPLIPTLQSLVLESLRPNAITDAVMTALSFNAESSPSHMDDILPALQSLSLSGSYLFSNAALLGMLESRGGSGMQRAQLHLKHRTFTEAELARLRALGEKGMALSVKCLDRDKQYVTVI
ncbi:hypothetical protein C8R43DRAFT_242594 [Mycena crocata]|nr:hypothetical protein C8R43DRAFT_242594 [Mycena crocata]